MRTEKSNLIILGAGDHAKIVIATIEAQAEYAILGLIDDNEGKHGTKWYGHPVLGGVERLPELKTQGAIHAVVAVGDNTARARLTELATEEGFEIVTAVHPSAVLLSGSTIGKGTVILPLAYVGADTDIGMGAILSVGVMVAHDCMVGDWCQLCPGARLGGHVRAGDYSFIGMGATVLPSVSVGQESIVGANAAVREDVPDSQTVVGVPARNVGEP